jgi:multiple sugar transport system permease protein
LTARACACARPSRSRSRRDGYRAGSPAPVRNESSAAKRSEEHGLGWLAVSPALLLLVSLLFGPVAAVVLFSLTDWQLGSTVFHFIGTANFRTLFSDPTFWKALSNTLIYVAIVVPGTVLLGLAVALLIEASPGLRGFYRAAHFLPVMSTMSAMAIVWGTMLHPTIGLVNRALGAMGILGVNWLRDERTALLALAVIGIWQGFGSPWCCSYPASRRFLSSSTMPPPLTAPTAFWTGCVS